MKLRYFILFVCLSTASAAYAQDLDLGKGFGAYQSYNTTDFDSVNLQNGNLILNVPLISYPQKGNLPDVSLSVTYQNYGWSLDYYYDDYGDEWTQWMFNGGGAYVAWLSDAVANMAGAGPTGYAALTSSGATHPLGFVGTGPTNPFILRALDGSGFSAKIPAMPGAPCYYQCPDGSGTIFTNDGIANYVGNGPNNTLIPVLQDPSGNTINIYNYVSSGVFRQKYVDSLNRSIPLPAVTVPPSCDTDNYPGPPGSSGGTVPITYCWTIVTADSNAFDPSQTYGYEGTGGGYWLHSVTLPNGTTWTFNYDTSGYGDLTSVTLPTGGTVSYTWNFEQTYGSPTNYTIYPRGIEYRDANADDGGGSKRWAYNINYTYDSGSSTWTGTDLATDPDSNDTVHTFGLGIYGGGQPFFETETQYYNGSHTSGTLLETINRTYIVSGALPSLPVWYGGSVPTFYSPEAIETTWPTTNQVRETCVTYDDLMWSSPCGSVTVSSSAPTFFDDTIYAWCYLNPGICASGTYQCSIYGICSISASNYQSSMGMQVESDEYDYGTSSPGSPLRKKVSHYEWQTNSSYLNAGMLGLPDYVYVYDGSSNMAAKTTYAYDESSRSASACQTTPCGLLTTTNQYTNSSTSLTSHTNYNSSGMPTDTYDPNGNHTCFSYDSTGAYLSEIQFPNPSSGSSCSSTLIEGLSYDSNTGLLTSQTDANSQTTSYTYDSMRRVTSVTYPDGGSEAYNYSGDSATPNPYFTYSKKITSGLNFTAEGIVDGLGRKKHAEVTSDPSGTDYVDYGYDNEGRLASVSNPHRTGASSTDGTTSYTYDALNRLTSVTEQDSSIVNYSYADSSSLHALCTTVSDEVGNKRETCNDGLGRMTYAFEPDPTSNSTFLYETDYTYSTLDKILQVQQKGNDGTSSDWRTRTFTYDWLSRLQCSAGPEIQIATCPSSDSGSYTAGTIRYTYDGDGNVLTKQAPQANQTSTSNTTITTYCYDALSRMTQKKYASASCPVSSPDVSYVYDGGSLPSGCSVGSFSYGSNANLQRTAMCDSNGSEAWNYDPMGRALNDQRTTNSLTKTFTYGYNYDSTIASIQYPSGRTITYGVNGAEQQISAEDTANSINYATTGLYYPPGVLNSLSNGAYLLSTEYYNSRVQPCRFAVNSSGTAPNSCTDSTHNGNIMDFTFNLNAGTADNGNILKVTDNTGNVPNFNYTYDTINRITAAYSDATSGSLCSGETFTIDPWSNLSAVATKSGYTGSGCANENLSLSISNKNQITNTNFAYDAAGNMTNDGGSHSYTYDTENRISQVGSSLNYYYDGDGDRVRKSSGTIYWYGLYDAPMMETDSSGNLTYEYMFFNGQRIARRDSSSNVEYYFADRLGSARVVTNASGSILERCYYYPYGASPNCTPTSTNNYLFTGKERDGTTSSETGLDNFGARYYSSQLMRFMTPDPVGNAVANISNPQTWNHYTYVTNNPLNQIDPTGTTSCTDSDNDGGDTASCQTDPEAAPDPIDWGFGPGYDPIKGCGGDAGPCGLGSPQGLSLSSGLLGMGCTLDGGPVTCSLSDIGFGNGSDAICPGSQCKYSSDGLFTWGGINITGIKAQCVLPLMACTTRVSYENIWISVDPFAGFPTGALTETDDARIKDLAGEINQRPIQKFVGTAYGLSVVSAAGGAAAPEAIEFVNSNISDIYDFVTTVFVDGPPPSPTPSWGEMLGDVVNLIKTVWPN